MVLWEPKPDGKQFEPFYGCRDFCGGTIPAGPDGQPVELDEYAVARRYWEDYE
jgi:hypothetical protein